MVEIALIVAAVIVAVVILIVRRGSSAAAKGGRRGGTGVRTLERDESIGYFRDLSGRGTAPGVQEEDRTGRWGSTDEPDDR